MNVAKNNHKINCFVKYSQKSRDRVISRMPAPVQNITTHHVWYFYYAQYFCHPPPPSSCFRQRRITVALRNAWTLEKNRRKTCFPNAFIIADTQQAIHIPCYILTEIYMKNSTTDFEIWVKQSKKLNDYGFFEILAWYYKKNGTLYTVQYAPP